MYSEKIPDYNLYILLPDRQRILTSYHDSQILRLHPDVVLMDIRMSKLSGLEVVKQAKEQGFQGKFIILSGYSDFSYAQEAIRYGVSCYLTKPIDEDEITSVIKVPHFFLLFICNPNGFP